MEGVLIVVLATFLAVISLLIVSPRSPRNSSDIKDAPDGGKILPASNFTFGAIDDDPYDGFEFED